MFKVPVCEVGKGRELQGELNGRDAFITMQAKQQPGLPSEFWGKSSVEFKVMTDAYDLKKYPLTTFFPSSAKM